MICHVANDVAVVCHGRVVDRAAETRAFDEDGRRAAWTTKTGHTIELREAVDGRIVVRRTLTRHGHSSDGEVAVTARGDLAWTRAGVFVKRAKRAPRRLGTGGGISFEDSRTLYWSPPRATVPRRLDLTPPPQRDGCPVRGRFKSLGETADVLVTQATYGRGYEAAFLVGACLRGSGHDVLLDATLGGGEYSFDDIGLAGISGRFVVLWRWSGASAFSGGTVTAYDAGTGRATRAANIPSHFDSDDLPDRTVPAVATAAGVPVWSSGPRILAIDPRGQLVTLDNGGPFTALHADGDSVSWLNNGVEHQAQPA